MIELLFTAFTIASYVWLLDNREKILRFLCDEIGELEICRAIVVIDNGREYYRMKKGVRVLDCEYLRYQPKSFNFVEKEMLITAPISGMSANSSVYIFLNQYDEEIGQIFQDLLRVVGRAIEDLEVRKREEELLKTVRENLKQFQYLSDKLRNPLAVIFGALELKDELGLEKACLMISESAEKIKRVLDEFSECEVQTIRLTRTIF